MLTLTGFFIPYKMAENKKSFLMYADMRHTTDLLTDEQAGQVFKWLLDYVNDDHPEPLPGLLGAVVEPIKQQMKRDLEKWDKIKAKRSEAGTRSAQARANKRQQASTNSTSVESVEQTPTNPTVTVTDTVTGTVINKYPNGLEFFTDDPIFLDSFNEWVTYRKEMRKPIRGQKAFQGQLSKLNRLSGGDYQKAKNIILQSIENNWTGLFELKNQTNDKSKQPRGEQIIDHNARIRKELRENQGRSSTGPL